jgi:cell division protein FtsA
MVDNLLIDSLKSCFKEIDIEINNYFDSGIASALSILTEYEKNEGVASIDIGALTTKVVVMNANKVIYSNVIPLGGSNVTNDLFKGLEISKESAETAKILNGTLSPNFNDKIEISIDSKNKKLINKNILSGIIKPRYEEILEIVRDNIFDNIYTRVSIKSIVISGGAGKIYGLNELSENIFNRKTRIATFDMKDSYFQNKPEFSTLLGLIKLARDYKKFEFTNKILSSKVHNARDKLDNWIEESYA